MKEFKLQELEAATDGFSPSQLIGKGSHGSVYKGTLQDNSLVAIKKSSLVLPDNTKLENEAQILSFLTTSPNTCHFILNLFVICRDVSGNTILVTEYLPNRTLHDLLHFSTTTPPWPTRLKFALHLAMAIRFLHESSIVHRDIKSTNILLDQHWNSKLADFGLSLYLNSSTTLPAGTIGYIDPNYTSPDKLSCKVDVYSFGVVLLELMSGRKAIDMAKSPPSVVEWAVPLIKQGKAMEIIDKRVFLPPYMEGRIKKVVKMAACCLSPMESIRPSMDEIMESIMEPVQVPVPLSLCGIIQNIILKSTKLRKKNNGCKGRLMVREILADIQ